MDGSTALSNRGGFGMKSQSIILLALVSSDTSCLGFRGFWERGDGKISEGRMFRLDRLLCINGHIGLPDALLGLERHVEIEPHQDQLSRPGSYHFDYGGR
jgi:hypothetical protein